MWNFDLSHTELITIFIFERVENAVDAIKNSVKTNTGKS